jgi:hypothetical protein
MHRRVEMRPAMLGTGEIVSRIVISLIRLPFRFGCTLKRLRRHPVDRFIGKIVRKVDPFSGWECAGLLRTGGEENKTDSRCKNPIDHLLGLRRRIGAGKKNNSTE